MGTALLTFGNISVTIILKTVSDNNTVTPEIKSEFNFTLQLMIVDRREQKI